MSKTIKVLGEDVMLDSDLLEINEVNLNDFFSTFASKYSYYNQKWAEAQYVCHKAEDLHEIAYAKTFKQYKDDGGSDKYAEAKAKAHPEVIDAKSKVRAAKMNTQMLWVYIRSLDKAHENALNLGYNIRKEIEKLFPQEIKGTQVNQKKQLETEFDNFLADSEND